jgi:catalase-peroxidase
MGLIYVNPEGVHGNRPGGVGTRHARNLRPHGDERRRNRRADRRWPHGRQGTRQWRCERAEPGAGSGNIEDHGLRLAVPTCKGKADLAVTSGSKAPGQPTRPSGTWATSSCCSAMSGKRPRARQARTVGANRTSRKKTCRSDASDPSKRRMPMMTDADMAMKVDPIYEKICRSSTPTRTISLTPLPAPGSS